MDKAEKINVYRKLRDETKRVLYNRSRNALYRYPYCSGYT